MITDLYDLSLGKRGEDNGAGMSELITILERFRKQRWRGIVMFVIKPTLNPGQYLECPGLIIDSESTAGLRPGQKGKEDSEGIVSNLLVVICTERTSASNPAFYVKIILHAWYYSKEFLVLGCLPLFWSSAGPGFWKP